MSTKGRRENEIFIANKRMCVQVNVEGCYPKDADRGGNWREAKNQSVKHRCASSYKKF